MVFPFSLCAINKGLVRYFVFLLLPLNINYDFQYVKHKQFTTLVAV